ATAQSLHSPGRRGSPAPLAKRAPSGEKANACTQPECPRRTVQDTSATSDRLRRRSAARFRRIKDATTINGIAATTTRRETCAGNMGMNLLDEGGPRWNGGHSPGAQTERWGEARGGQGIAWRQSLTGDRFSAVVVICRRGGDRFGQQRL